jgi:transcriptional/translational regulatory protein YebC/TACO1
MSGHTKWSEIKHKKRGTPALQIIVYDLTGKNLPDEAMAKVTAAVEGVVRQYDTLAHTSVTR